MSHLFYSRRKQYTREWRVLFTLHRTDIVLGCIYVFISFYFFRTIGQSQVYNVVFPYFMASFVTAYITYNVCGPQVRGKTLLYFSGLPRERNVVWRSHTAFVLFIVICLEAITGVGIALKLGGAGITQVYRLHPRNDFIAHPDHGLCAAERIFALYKMGYPAGHSRGNTGYGSTDLLGAGWVCFRARRVK